jgi:hypothetical protein
MQLQQSIESKETWIDEYLKWILFMQSHEKNSNSDVQNICCVIKRTASRYFSQLYGKSLKKAIHEGCKGYKNMRKIV